MPTDQIVNLRDEAATRSAILREIRALGTRRAENGDPILIYFAGHGATVPAPHGWVTASGRISTIVAYDSLAKNRVGALVHPIPDRTIAALLDELAGTGAESEGSNIVSDVSAPLSLADPLSDRYT